MGLFGHWWEILLILMVGLLVFGPKRMIEMGSSFGKMFREFREATKDINLSNLLNDTGSNDEPSSSSSTLSRLSQVAQNFSITKEPLTTPTASEPVAAETTTYAPASEVVEGSIKE